MNRVPAANGVQRPAGTYMAHLRALEEAADRLERTDLDPEQALEIFEQAQAHHRAAAEILDRVEQRFRNLCPGGDS